MGVKDEAEGWCEYVVKFEHLNTRRLQVRYQLAELEDQIRTLIMKLLLEDKHTIQDIKSIYQEVKDSYPEASKLDALVDEVAKPHQ